LHIVCSGLIKLTFNCLLLRLIIGVGKTEGGPHIRSVWRKKVGAINLYTYDWIIAVPAELAQRATTHLDFHSHSHPHYARGVVLKPKRGWGRGSRGQVEQNSAKLNWTECITSAARFNEPSIRFQLVAPIKKVATEKKEKRKKQLEKWQKRILPGQHNSRPFIFITIWRFFYCL